MSKPTSLEKDMADDFSHNTITETTRRLNGVENRVRKLEATVQAVYEHLTDATDLPQPLQADANEQAALNTLAKAQNAVRRNMTPKEILELGMQVLTDPTAVGVLESYVNGGQLKKAAEMLAAAEARVDRDGEDDALERVENQMDRHRQVALVSELGDKVVSFECTLNALMSRLNRLEAQARPQAAAPAPTQTTVAKAGQFGRRQVQSTDYRDTAEGLLSRLEAVVDSPAKVGHVASMIQGGDVEQARRIIEAAELHHETAMEKRDRRGL